MRTYLKFLADTLLVRAIDPLEIRLERDRAPPQRSHLSTDPPSVERARSVGREGSRSCLADHALRARA